MKLNGYRYLTNAEVKALIRVIKRTEHPDNLTYFLYSLNDGKTSDWIAKRIEMAGVSSKTLERKIKRWSEKAGISNVTWNTLKYTFIVRAREKNVPFSEIATKIGKSKQFTINVYRNLMMNGE
jgi:hypothetical protein